METTAGLNLFASRKRSATQLQRSTRLFAGSVLACVCLSAVFATWLPLQLSIIAVFLFAGPHNWFEFRYFLMRLPVRFGKSRNFFLFAFAGIGLLTIGYISLPLIYASGLTAGWTTMLAAWNSLLLLWLGVLVWLRGKQKLGRDWSWAIPVAFALTSLNWIAPQFFSLAIVYLHPIIAFWFLDRHLRRTRPEWLKSYHACLCLLPVLLGLMIWYLSGTPALPDDNGLFWRITQHAGAELLPNVSAQILVSVHVFLEMLHYAVWIVALPLIAAGAKQSRNTRASDTQKPGTASKQHGAVWDRNSIPLARHPRGFPRLIGAFLLVGLFVVVALWLGFSLDYSTTRDIYFTVAIAHVLAEAPFLLRML